MNLKRFLFICIGALAIVGCGPVFETRHNFTPPKSESGRFCIYQCDNSKVQCQQTEDLKEENCQYRSEIEQANCEAHIWATKNREPKWYECGGSSCSADYERCEHGYRSCYQACGGKVDSVTECVSGCEQLPAGKR